MPANNRFSDNPFRDPNLTPEQVERIEKRNEALRIYRETGMMGQLSRQDCSLLHLRYVLTADTYGRRQARMR